MKQAVIFSSIFLLLISSSVQVVPQSVSNTNKGTVYVPAYSSIFHSNLQWKFHLSITLSIHNTDLKNNIIITAIDYYNSSGTLIHKYITDKPLKLKPLETYNLGIKEADTRGGVGANFIVTWQADPGVNNPLVETIMIGTRGQQGISFTSRGVTISE